MGFDQIVAKYSDPLPCDTCKYALPPIGKFSRTRNCLCEKYSSRDNMKPNGVLFSNEECKEYEEKNKTANDGGPGSGNFGHKGRPGQVGGSGKGEGSGSSSKKSAPEIGESIDPDFDIFNFEDDPPTQAELEKYAESARKSLDNLAKSYHMKGIVETAKKTKGDSEKFLNSMSKVQKEAFDAQYRDSGTEESFTDYVKRMQDMLAEVPFVPDLENKVVDGKDITESYKYRGVTGYYNKASESIDTKIEDIIHQQGFDGIPKVVSKEEFDKIVKENPEMPVLVRAYTAQNAETLNKYNEDLEKGFFYVDCGVGGAQYGQGMYCAGVYRSLDEDTHVRQWDDPDLRQSFEDEFVFKDDKGDGYFAKEVNPENGDDLYVDTLYMWIDDRTQEPRLLKRDEDSLIWEDVGKGGIVRDDEIEDLLNKGSIFECKSVDTSIYDNKREEDFKKGLEAAGKEADHYLVNGIERIMDYYPPKPPEGKDVVPEWREDSYYYYDTASLTPISDGLPEDGTLIAITLPDGTDPRMYVMRHGEVTMTFDPSSSLSLNYWKEKGFKWAKIEGRVEDFNPIGTVRKMTLDPSAKIISYSDIHDIMYGKIPSDVEEKVSLDYFDKKVQGTGIEGQDYEYMKNKYMEMCGYGSYTSSNRHARLEEKYDRTPMDTAWATTLEKMARDIHNTLWSEELFKLEDEYHKKARLYEMKFQDYGELAAALGYDAINAEGHGGTMSYTVVLNRTKVILQKEPM